MGTLPTSATCARGRPQRALAFLVAGALGAPACTADDSGPRIATVLPEQAAAGSAVTISGERLCGGYACDAAPARITLGESPPMIDVQVESYADTIATFLVPDDAPVGATVIIATVADQSSNAQPFEVVSP